LFCLAELSEYLVGLLEIERWNPSLFLLNPDCCIPDGVFGELDAGGVWNRGGVVEMLNKSDDGCLVMDLGLLMS